MRMHGMRRVAFAAVLAGIVGAGQWLLVKADVPQVGANNWASAGDFGAMPSSWWRRRGVFTQPRSVACLQRVAVLVEVAENLQ